MRAAAAELAPKAKFVDSEAGVLHDPDIDCLLVVSRKSRTFASVGMRTGRTPSPDPDGKTLFTQEDGAERIKQFARSIQHQSGLPWNTAICRLLRH